MNSLQQLKSVIQATVPSIMELKFGCEMRKHESKYVVLDSKNNWIHLFNVTFGSTVFGPIRKDEYEILGRPIRLADVLLAIGLKDKIVIGGDGIIGTIAAFGPIIIVKAKWNLKDDSLDNQSPECKDFLINLLVK